MPEEPTTRWWRPTTLVVSIILLARAIEVGGFSVRRADLPTAMVWLTLAIIAATIAIFLPPLFRVNRRGFLLIAGVGLIANLLQLIATGPFHSQHESSFSPLDSGVIFIALFGGFVLATTGSLRLLAFLALMVCVGLAGVWIIYNTPNPFCDVCIFQTDSTEALATGKNPYDMTFPDIYGPPFANYAPGVVKDRRLQFGYPYLPETLYYNFPAKWLKLDLRTSQLLAIILTAAMIVVIRRDDLGYTAALLLLTMPELFRVVALAYIEPFCALTLAATIACMVRAPRYLPVALGLFLVSKQYTTAAALLFLIGSRPWRASLVILCKAAVVAIIVTIPLALWNWHAFLNSAIILQFRQPFRVDSMSYLAWASAQFWPKGLQIAIPFIAFFTAISLVFWRRRTLGFASAVAFCFLIFFAFNKQAFGNYYFFVAAALACAIAEPVGEGSGLARIEAHRVSAGQLLIKAVALST